MLNKTPVRFGLLVTAAVAAAALFAACAQESAPPEQPSAVEDSPFVAPLPADSPEMAVPGPGGVMPCGMGRVGWGRRVFRLGDFPACQSAFPNLTVYCLDANATWVDVTVSSVAVSPADNTVAFESSQEGLCALFPASE